MSGLGFSLVTVFIPYLKLAEGQEGGVVPLPAVGECELVGLDHQMILDYQWLVFMFRTELTFPLCAHYSQVDQKAAKQRQSSGASDSVIHSGLVET